MAEQTPAAAQETPKTASEQQLEKLLASVANCRKVLILTHDNPDPDSISSAVALQYLLTEKLKIKSRIVYGGAIVRPENRIMVQRLKMPIEPISTIRWSDYTAIAIVDTQPGFGNNSLPEEAKPVIVIDHHPSPKKDNGVVFMDLRPKYGATATIMTEYLLASGLPIPTKLATALFYGIATETQDLGREATEMDNKAYLALFPLVNKKVLSQIRYAPVSRSYFQHLEVGLRNSFTYKNVIGTRLGQVDGQDIVPLMADLLLRMERMSWSIVLGRWEGRLYVSIRTKNTRAKCGRLLRRILGRKGSAGGHDMIAGGSIPLNGRPQPEIEDLEDQLIRKFMHHVGHKEILNFEKLVAPCPLVPQKEPDSQTDPADSPAVSSPSSESSS